MFGSRREGERLKEKKWFEEKKKVSLSLNFKKLLLLLLSFCWWCGNLNGKESESPVGDEVLAASAQSTLGGAVFEGSPQWERERERKSGGVWLQKGK